MVVVLGVYIKHLSVERIILELYLKSLDSGRESQNSLRSIRSSDHDGSLSVTSRNLGVHASINNKQVLSTPNLGVRVDDALAVVGRTHLGSAKVVATATSRSNKSLGSGVLGNTQDAVRLAGVLEESVNHGSQSLNITLGVQERLLGHVGSSLRRDLDGADGGGTVGEVDLDANGVVGISTNGALDMTGSAISGVDGSPEVQALTRLSHETAALGEEVDGGLVGAGPSSAGEGNKLVLGGEGDGGDGMILEVLADRKLNPLLLGRKLDVGVAGSNDLDLGGRADAGVEQDTGSGVGAGGQDQGSALGQVDDLASTAVVLDLNAGNQATLTDGTEDLGVKLEVEVGEGLGVGEDSADRAVTEAVCDLNSVRLGWDFGKDVVTYRPGRVRVHQLLSLNIVQRILLAPAIGI